MKTFIGDEKDVRNLTYQEKWYPTCTCKYCGEEAVLIRALMEEHSDVEYVYEIYDNGGEKGTFWPHDLVAIAIYFCRYCFNVTSFLNEG